MAAAKGNACDDFMAEVKEKINVTPKSNIPKDVEAAEKLSNQFKND